MADDLIERLISAANRYTLSGDYKSALSLVYRADRRLVSLLLGASSQLRFDRLTTCQWRLNAAYLYAKYRAYNAYYHQTN
jgi:hypothetical protein